MFTNEQDYFEPLSFTAGGYSGSPDVALLPTELDFPVLDLPTWDSTTLLDDEHDQLLRTPPLSRSSSLDSLDFSLPEVQTAIFRPSSQKAGGLELTWSADGQLNPTRPKLPKLHTAKSVAGSSVDSTASSPVSPHSEPHHEGSCSRCRLTEAEARKCRLERRREQNRASQRKFRARKEAKIREAASQVATLEQYVDFLEKHNSDLEMTNADLQQRLEKFENRHSDRPIPAERLISPGGIRTLS